MQDFENTEPLSEEAFQQEMNRPSTLNDVFFGQLRPDIAQNFWQQPHVFSRGANEMAPPLNTQGGHMAQADFNFDGHTMGQQSTGFDMATPGNATFGSAPGGLAVGAPGGGFPPGNGGYSAATSRTVSPGPDTSQNYGTGSALQPGSEFDGHAGGGPAFD
ncbi:hypothetical protein LA080_011430 [Diaporthe eres]|uniref:Uncharacterized protein n=1 Tax=Diaporthe vaccinii TaxID=105482 RepID=A0ABR4EMP1_9PEZI|nr:hypothetical protein LA080_011430 [Diaporthe eres]